MNNAMRSILIMLGVILVGAIVLFVGFTIGLASSSPFSLFSRSVAALTGNSWNINGYPMGNSMMGYRTQGSLPSYDQMGPGRMGRASGMMGESFGMMGYAQTNGLSNVDPLTLSEAREAVEDYLVNLDDENLAIGEIMIFDNHAYAQIIEEDTGIGALEVLVDPLTLAVTPEHGPTMMWNLKYGPMSGMHGSGMMGLMRGGGFHGFNGWRGLSQGITGLEGGTEMRIDPAEAVSIAQEYLTGNFPGTSADDHVDPFYGYYTLHILRDGEIVGMLSVNGFTGQVFPHTWHGDFIEMTAESDH